MTGLTEPPVIQRSFSFSYNRPLWGSGRGDHSRPSSITSVVER